LTNFLDEKRKEIDARLRELRPMVDEYQRLEKAAAALAQVDGGGPTRRRRGARGTRRRGRPRGSGTRSLQALELVKAKPGITISELADSMGIKANYLYRVLPQLEADGKVKKRKKGWHPA
jgi:predicted Rossmann fold nucleotide-binding protein DprA/Smf involved in DNA uptake